MSMVNVKIGTCGFGRTKRPDYVKNLPVVEIQHTFYQPPMIETLEKWRRDVPEDFEFTLKAWQLITHEATSPTYKRCTRFFTEAISAGEYGSTPSLRFTISMPTEKLFQSLMPL